MNLIFFLNSIFLGVGLAMDAFSVSCANTLHEPGMSKAKMCGVAGCYGFFQWFMPMTGWICVHTILELFTAFQKFIPWIALLLLLYIGGKMIWESFHEEKDENDSVKTKKLTFRILIIQGIATSIDALSVGFTIADYKWHEAFVSALIIAAVTWCISFSGLIIGKKAGTKLGKRADILGGTILILIGLEIWAKGFLLALLTK